MGIKSRILLVKKQKSLKLKDLADQLGVNYQTVQRYFSGDRSPSTDFLAAFSNHLDVSGTWLLTGKGPMSLTEKAPSQPGTPSGFFQVPILDIDASAGGGARTDQELVSGSYAFSQAWIEQRELVASQLAVIGIRGDSMEPELKDKDLILLSRDVRNLDLHSIYVVQYSDSLYVKRIQRRYGGSIRLISTNKIYDPIEVDNPEEENLQIVGRVVASMHEW